jgi:hypothetical protein
MLLIFRWGLFMSREVLFETQRGRRRANLQSPAVCSHHLLRHQVARVQRTKRP